MHDDVKTKFISDIPNIHQNMNVNPLQFLIASQLFKPINTSQKTLLLCAERDFETVSDLLWRADGFLPHSICKNTQNFTDALENQTMPEICLSSWRYFLQQNQMLQQQFQAVISINLGLEDGVDLEILLHFFKNTVFQTAYKNLNILNNSESLENSENLENKIGFQYYQLIDQNPSNIQLGRELYVFFKKNAQTPMHIKYQNN